MANITIREFVEQHPHVMKDNPALTFSKGGAAEEVTRTLARYGVVMLRDVLPAASLRTACVAFQGFMRTLGRKPLWPSWARDEGPSPQWAQGETNARSWHKPWTVRYWNRRPTAIVVPELIRSWAWPTVEALCGSTDIAILFEASTARHAIDVDLGVGAHQDAKVVSPALPFSIWIPLHAVRPGKESGLGFVVGSFDRVLQTNSSGDIGHEPIVDHPDSVWVPAYGAGDVSIHASHTPHFTTGFGTGSHRYSLEIRAIPRTAMDEEHDGPSIYIGRRDGKPAVVGANRASDRRTRGFLGTLLKA